MTGLGSACTSKPSNLVEFVVTCVWPVTLSSATCLRVFPLGPCRPALGLGHCPSCWPWGSSLHPQRVHMLKCHSDESETRTQPQGGKDLGLGVRASESDRVWGTGHVFVRKTPRNKVRGPGRWKRGGVCSVLDPGLWDGAGPGPASVMRLSPTPCGRDGRVQATWGAGSEERPRLCGGSLGMCLQVCPFVFSGLNIACILTASTLVTGSAAATRARSPGPGPGCCHGRGRLPRAATPAPPACSSACRPLLRCADPSGS